MIPFPLDLEPYRLDAEKALAAGVKQEIEFSRETYQVAVQDPQTNREEWVFFQFDEQGELKDHFCSCQESTTKKSCLHQATALLAIYGGYSVPLHLRFQRSLWYMLTSIGLRRYGDDEALIRWKEGEVFFDAKRKKDFFLVFHDVGVREQVRSKIEDRPIETEETSIKFSNLAEEEIEAWHRGNTSLRLQYDLSYWSDLGKWWIALQESVSHYAIYFSYDQEKIPDRVQIVFPSVTIDCALRREELLEIIPTLAFVPSPLEVQQERIERLQRIEFDQERAVFVIHKKQEEEKQKREFAQGISLGPWLYLPKKGFVNTSEPSWMEKREIGKKEIARMLLKHLDVLEKYLEGTPIHRTKRAAQYLLYFDQEWNFHLELYIFQPGDLTSSGTLDFGEWFYLPGKGFFPIEGRLFPQLHTVVPNYHVGEFVRHHRIFFDHYPGFQTHLSAIEGKIAYSVSEAGRLTFTRILKKRQEFAVTRDFGFYLYVEGEGFYPKGVLGSATTIRPGMRVSSDQIPLFIGANREELATIPGFFSETCPVISASLHVGKVGEEEIEVFPHYTLAAEYEGKMAQFFEEFVYVPEEGFIELTGSLRLPDAFRHRVPIPTRKTTFFFQEVLPQIQSKVDWMHPHLQLPQMLQLTVQSLRKLKKEEGEEYEGFFTYQSELGLVSLAAVWKGIRKKKRFLLTPAGRLDLHDRRFLWLKKIAEEKIHLKQNLLFLSPLQFIRINALEEIEVVAEDVEAERESLLFFHEITNFVTPLPPDQKGFLSHLRPYQQTGLQWLWFLYQHSLSGLLCDEMGLGKTHQAMGLIASVMNTAIRQKGGAPQFLVICPTSVLYHWKEKIQEYLPAYRVFTFYGTKRNLSEFTAQHHILLTSYGIWRNEREKLQAIAFELAFFDEIQVAKNPQSRIYHALKRVQAKTKIGLTGTPIENHLRELKTLFDLILPTYMPNDKEYREIFVKPIEKERSLEKKKLLSRFINPFILRRKKKDVLVDLPEKIEEIAHCDLIAEQDRLYREVLSQGRMQILPHLQDSVHPIPYMHIFTLLTRLKQICDHPAVYWKQPEEYTHHASGKWELFRELLSEALESEQKVVVYSQYLHMLDIIEMYLEEQNISYASLRGRTIDRGEQVERFHKDPQCRVFVGSLHAAGLGIDLTPASVVMHYDRWWNAAKENQATDRVHRIGQRRGVQVFKFMTLNTFEERIDQLIQGKQNLLEDIVGIDDQDVIKTFSREEILQLLEYVEHEEMQVVQEEENG